MDQPPENRPDDLSSSGPSPCDITGELASTSPVIGGRIIVEQAQVLAREFGSDALAAAALRAAHSRASDNPYSYCRWREVTRVLNWMAAPSQAATHH